MTFFYDTFTTPFGEFSIAVDRAGAAVATAFGPIAVLQTRLGAFRAGAAAPSPGQRRGVALKHGEAIESHARSMPVAPAAVPNGTRTVHLIRDPRAIAPARDQFGEYFAGRRRTFDLTLAPAGTAFQQRVWSALLRIPFGATRSYGQLGSELDLPGSARAVGRANSTNPLCVVVPCHRVLGHDRSLTGFAFGESLKRQLLTHEGVPLGSPLPTLSGVT